MKKLKQCKNKWFMLNKQEADEYETKINKCKNCSNPRYPYFVHDQYGDYYCLHCEKEGEIKLFCIKCNSRR